MNLQAIVLALIVVIGIAAIPIFRLKHAEFKRTGKHPKGYYMGRGIALGIVIGMPIGLALGNIALGPAIGLPIGVAIGTSMEEKHAHELRPLTEKEKKLQKLVVSLLVFLLVAGIGVFFLAAKAIG